SEIAGRQECADARRERQPRLGAAQHLIAIVESEIAEAGAASQELAGAEHRLGKAQLVTRMLGDRPLLGEGVRPVLAVPEARDAADVLDDARLLVIGLLQQE